MISLVGKRFMKKEKFNVSLQPQFLSDLSSGEFFSHLKVEKTPLRRKTQIWKFLRICHISVYLDHTPNFYKNALRN